MLTQKDIDLLKETFPAKEDLDEKTRRLPSGDDFFTRMDMLTGEIKAAREELELHTGQHDEIREHSEKTDKRLTRIEKRLKLPPLAD